MSSHNFDKQRWANMDIFNQMGNIGSEVDRALNAKRTGQTQRSESAYKRALDLIDFTLELQKGEQNPRARELELAKSQLLECMKQDKIDPALSEYFMEFAIAARLQAGK